MTSPAQTQRASVPGNSSTTRLLLSLQWRLWKRTVSGNPAITMMAVLAGFYALIGLVTGSVLVFQGLTSGPSTLVAAVVGAGVLGYLMLALFMPSGEGQLRPTSFTLLPVTSRELTPAMAISTMMQARGVIAAICTLVTLTVATVAAATGGRAWLILVVVPMTLLGLVTALLLGELLAAVIGSGGRVSRERTGVFGMLVFLVVVVGYSLVTSSGIGTAEIELFGRILSWTPMGATGGVIAAVAQGSWVIAVLQLLIAVATIILGTWWWRNRIDRELRAPLDAGTSATEEKETRGQRRLLLPGVPDTPAGAVFSRAFRYLRRDSRLLPSVIMVPLMGVFFLVQGLLGQSGMIYFGAVFMALLAGTVASNDFGYDGPAGWLHLVTGVPPRTQLLARHAASAAPMFGMLLLYVVVMVILAPDTGLAALVGIAAVGMLGTSLGVALLLTTFNPYPTSKPGTNPWSDKSGYSGAAFIAAFTAIFLGWIPSAPGGAMMLIGHGSGAVGLIVSGVVLALLLPGVFYAVAIHLCGRRVSRERVAIQHRVRHWVN